MPKNRCVDQFLVTLSVPICVVLILLLLVEALLVALPCYLLSCSCLKKRRTTANRSVEEGGSTTAKVTMFARAIAASCGFGPDLLSTQFAKLASISKPRNFAAWLMGRTYYLGSVLQFKLTRTILDEQVSRLLGKKARFGKVGILHARTCFLDDMVETFVEQHGSRECQLVILGAGYDTRCQRLPLQPSITSFEVDAPGTQDAKRSLIAKITGADDSLVTYISVDFETESWMQKLVDGDFRKGLPTCFVWEGVTMHLDLDVIEATLAEVKGCAPGSVIGFDYLDTDYMDTMRPRMKKIGEPWKWGVRVMDAHQELKSLAERQGLRLDDHLQAEELLRRYCPTRASGDSACFLLDFGGFAVMTS